MKKLYFAILLTIFLVTAAFAEVNINTAAQKELTTLAGIGPAKAAAIVKHREQNGLFKDISNVKDVKGIGDKIFEKIKEKITIDKNTIVGNKQVVQENK
ncbi:MAG: helix-hairpin-helix domain-containing protein [Candidatus Electrothrix sp. AR3]|nr:helix-hairpin-helix domain-containing protein [Candidatus Electrothrix sp. AR3]